MDKKAVKISCYVGQGSFDGDKPGDYETFYKAEPAKTAEILPYFYPETSVVRMMEIRRRYES